MCARVVALRENGHVHTLIGLRVAAGVLAVFASAVWGSGGFGKRAGAGVPPSGSRVTPLTLPLKTRHLLVNLGFLGFSQKLFFHYF